MTVSAPPEDPPIPSLATAVRRGVLLGTGLLQLIVWRLAVWNPWNVDTLQHATLESGFLATSVVLLSVCIEGLCTFRGCFPRLLLSLAAFAFALLTLIAVWTAAGWKEEVTQVAAVSPDGRVQAEWVNQSGPFASSTGLVLRTYHGLNRHSTVLTSCNSKPASGIIRFADNRTLELVDRNGRVTRVHFDKNLDHRRVGRSCGEFRG
ncbi:hypothetical protein [Streptomyces sp. SID3343]|uniref:hypothetical protein n=1 Tax=Streptomyces sp. SID3343 TaxID=2690260 RepID=UPI00136CB061|nr:hypothetical protein [Streptomyces sp. SID3343]MYW04319.1 hypothetical protein [Streptomyces sp. SID3343]